MADATYVPDVGTPVRAEARGWRDSKALKRFRRNPLAVVGLLVVLAFVLTAIFAPVLTNVGRNCLRDLGLSAATQYDYKNPTKAVFWRTMFAPPESCFTIPRVGFSNVPRDAETSETLLGTTSGGYDIYYGLIWGTRTAFKIGLIVVGISLLAGLIIGSLSGYIGGVFDNVLMRFTDIVISLPSLVIAMVVVMVLGNSISNIMFAIAVVAWPSYARLMRGEVLRVKEEDYVTSAKALGRRSLGVIFRHVLPNAIGPLIIVASLDIGSIVLTAAALSFLGLGNPDPSTPEWGKMLADAQRYIEISPGLAIYPATAIIVTAFGFTLLGEAMREALDPKLRT